MSSRSAAESPAPVWAVYGDRIIHHTAGAWGSKAEVRRMSRRCRRDVSDLVYPADAECWRGVAISWWYPGRRPW